MSGVAFGIPSPSTKIMTYEEIKDLIKTRTVAINNYTGIIDYVSLIRQTENEFILNVPCTFKSLEDDSSADADYSRPTTPTDFYRETKVFWDGLQLTPIGNMNMVRNHRNSDDSVITGTPYFYIFEGNNIQLFPQPTSGGIFRMDYICLNESTIVNSNSPIIPVSDHKYLADHVIARVAEINGNYDMATHYDNKFNGNMEARKRYYGSRQSKQVIVSDGINSVIKKR